MKCSSQNAQSTSSDFSYIRSVPLVFVQRNICDVLRFKSGCGATPHAVIPSHPNAVIPSRFCEESAVECSMHDEKQIPRKSGSE
jgi:hypothetical protein